LLSTCLQVVENKVIYSMLQISKFLHMIYGLVKPWMEALCYYT